MALVLAVAAAAASLTRYEAVALVPILFVLNAIYEKRARRHLLWAGLAAAGFLAWMAASVAHSTHGNPYLSQIERGLHEPSVRVLKAISGALNVSMETLLARAGVLSDDADDGPGTERAILDDPQLTDDQRSSLLAVYRSYVDANRRP